MFRRAVRRVSGGMNIYCAATADTDIAVVHFPASHAPSIGMDSDDRPAPDFDIDVDVDEKEGKEKEGRDGELAPERLKAMQVRWLIDIPQQPSQLNQSILRFKCCVSEIAFWTLEWRCWCKKALIPTHGCYTHGPRTERVFHCQAQINIDDGSSTAIAFIGDDAFWELIDCADRSAVHSKVH